MKSESNDVEVFQRLPVSINCFYGDSLQPSQWKNTLSKLEDLHLTNHQGPILIPTKFAITHEQVDIISRYFPNVWIFLAVTGLNESNLFSFDDYKKAYLTACEKLNNVVCAIRPIVPSHNDRMEVIEPILRMVVQGNKMLLFRGFRDPSDIHSEKYINDELFSQLKSYCEHHKILSGHRTACIVAKAEKKQCVIHDTGQPQNLDLIQKFGYLINLNDSCIQIDGFKDTKVVSKGDINFVRMLSKSKVLNKNIDKTEVMSVKLKGNRKFVCTSSWFSWSRQVPCIINCWYCFAAFNSPVRVKFSEFGCNPKYLLELVYDG